MMRYCQSHLVRLYSDSKLAVHGCLSSSINVKSHSTTTKQVLKDAPSLKDFLISQRSSSLSNPSLINEMPEIGHTVDTAAKDITKATNVIDTVSLNFYIETYGCQMNSNDSEIVRSILLNKGHAATTDIDNADIILTNTCAIRENAENKVWHRLAYFQSLRNQTQNKRIRKSGFPLVGVLGCMAERLKTKLLEGNKVDFVCGPDAYRDIPRLIDAVVSTDQKNANTQLSFEETYADISPVRVDENSVSAYVSIMRGCNNMCSFCIVPFTRGRERSRECESIVKEVQNLVNQGVREVVLLGQNVNGYHDIRSMKISSNSNSHSNNSNSDNITTDTQADSSREVNIKVTKNRSNSSNTTTSNSSSTSLSSTTSLSITSTVSQSVGGVSSSGGYKSTPGFTNLYHSKAKSYDGIRFADLLTLLAAIHPELRIRFTSPHPKDFPHAVLTVIAQTPNICKSVHIPLQSGNNLVLARMRRGYTQEAYLNLITTVRTLMPQISISTDVIVGFCDETDAEHQDTIKVLQTVQYDQAFMYAYSLRDKTHAARVMKDNIPENVKQQRLQEIIATYRAGMLEKNKTKELGRIRLVLIEGYANKSNKASLMPLMTGRTDGNKRVLFPAIKKEQMHISLLPASETPSSLSSSSSQQNVNLSTGINNNSNNNKSTICSSNEDCAPTIFSSLTEVLLLKQLVPQILCTTSMNSIDGADNNYLHSSDIMFIKKSHSNSSCDTTSLAVSNNNNNNNNNSDDDDEDSIDTNINNNNTNNNNNNDAYEDVDKVKGRYVMVHITEANGSTLRGEIIAFTTLHYFHQLKL